MAFITLLVVAYLYNETCFNPHIESCINQTPVYSWTLKAGPEDTHTGGSVKTGIKNVNIKSSACSTFL